MPVRIAVFVRPGGFIRDVAGRESGVVAGENRPARARAPAARGSGRRSARPLRGPRRPTPMHSPDPGTARRQRPCRTAHSRGAGVVRRRALRLKAPRALTNAAPRRATRGSRAETARPLRPPRSRAQRAHRRAESHRTALRQGDHHVNELLRGKGAILGAELRAGSLRARSPLMSSIPSRVLPSLATARISSGKRADSALTSRCKAIACGASAA